MSVTPTSVLTCAAAAIAVCAATPAFAQAENLQHSLALAEREGSLSQRMAKEIALIALGYNRRENIRNLEYNHEQFSRILNGLRYGDAELALQPTSHPGILENINRVGEIWPMFDGAVEEAVASGSISGGQVRLIADLSEPLLAAIEDLVEEIEKEAQRGQLFSMIAVSVEMSGHSGMLTQRMAKDFFLVALDHQPQRNRQLLQETMNEFDGILTGLTVGDLDRMLLPAPTPQIQGQLRTINRLWEEMQEALGVALRGGEIDEDMISLVASMNLNILQELNTVTGMYEAL